MNALTNKTGLLRLGVIALVLMFSMVGSVTAVHATRIAATGNNGEIAKLDAMSFDAVMYDDEGIDNADIEPIRFDEIAELDATLLDAVLYDGGDIDLVTADDLDDIAFDDCEEPMFDSDYIGYEYPMEDFEYVTISGVVKDNNGHPIPNVWISTGAEIWMMDGIMECGLIPGGGGETDSDGAFSISVIAENSYDLFIDSSSVAKLGLIGGYFQDADGGNMADLGPDGKWSGETTNDWEQRSLIAIGSEDVSDISITLNPGTKIYGKAIDTNGKPVKDLWIEAQAEVTENEEGKHFRGGWSGASTDEAGNFSAVVIPGAKYRISSWPWKGGLMGGYWKADEDNGLTGSGQDGVLTPDWNAATLVDTAADAEINLIFKASNTISGRITDEAGDPVPDIWVNAASGELHPDVVYLDEDGKYEDEDAEEPIYYMPEPHYYGASTDKDGHYEIAVYPASDYRMSVWNNGLYQTTYYKNASNWEDSTPVDASNASVTGIDFVLNMGASISGTLSGLAEGDTASVEVWSDSRGGWGNVRVVGTGSDVSFKVRGLSEGDDYRMNIWAEGYLNGYVQEDGTLGPWDEAALFSADTANVNITLDTGKKISGTLTGLSQGDSVWIDAYSESKWSKGGTRVTAEGTRVEFTISALADAEDFRISVNANGYVSGYYGGPGSAPVAYDQATLVSTKDGDASGISILMSTGNTISGTIAGLDEGARAGVSAWSESAGSYGYAEVIGTGSDVAYEIKCLNPAEDFRVSIWADGYIGGYYGDGDVTDWENAELVDASANPGNVDFTLSKGSTISGTITGLGEGEWATIEAWREMDFFVEPMPYMEKEMFMSDWCGTGRHETGWGGASWGSVTVKGTGAPVKYTISGLVAADDFSVSFWSKGYAKLTETGIDSGSDPTNIDFTATEGNRVSGSISNADANQWVWINVQSEGTRDGAGTEVKADKDGNAVYEIKGLGFGNDYVVSAWADRKHLFYDQQMSYDLATQVDLSQGSAENVNFDFDAIEMFTITGTIAGVEDKTKVWIDAWSEREGAWGNAEVRGNDQFSMELPAGNYRIGIYADGYLHAYYDGESGVLADNWADGSAVAVRGNLNLGSLTLSAGHSISGVVTDTDGETVEKVWIDVYSEGKGFGGGDATNRNGEYRISGLGDGTYVVNVWSFAGYFEGEVTLAGEDVTFDIVLGGDDTGNIAGSVDGGDVVLLFDGDGKFVNAMETDDSGEYAFKGLGVGEYTVKVRTQDDVAAAAYDLEDGDATSERPADTGDVYEVLNTVTVQVGETASANK